MGWLGWTLAGVVALAIGLYGTYRYAVWRNPPAVLDWADMRFRSGDEARLVEATRYGADPAQKVRVYLPARPAPGPLPVVVFVHGGSWASGDPDDYGFIARTLAPHGYAVVLAGYRLYPRAVFPGMVEDTGAAVRWVRDHAAGFGGDPARIVLMGHSAGAYNIAMLALDREWQARAGLTDHDIRGVVGLAGPYDFAPFTSPATIASFGQAKDPEATQPLNYVRRDAPALLLLTGDADTTVKPRNSLALAKAMTAAGAPTKAQVFTGMDHSSILMNLAQPFARRDARVLDAVLPFLRKVTGGAASAQVQPPAAKPAA